jgi:hypothetical protein
MKHRVQSLVHSKPDFGYPEQLEFGEKSDWSKGWGFFMDMISKYRQREKISNTINHFNEVKRKWKEEEIEKMSLKVHSLTQN